MRDGRKDSMRSNGSIMSCLVYLGGSPTYALPCPPATEDGDMRVKAFWREIVFNPRQHDFAISRVHEVRLPVAVSRCLNFTHVIISVCP